jgi:hypothetical protein
MRPHRAALRHNAFVYESPEEYVERSVAFLREGLEAGEGGIVAHTRPGLAAMREALGADAARVRFVNVETAYTRPARTLAAYHRVYVDELRDVGSPTRASGTSGSATSRSSTPRSRICRHG